MENIFLVILKVSCSAGLITLFILSAEKFFMRSCIPKFRYYIWLLVVIRLTIPFDYEIQIAPQVHLGSIRIYNEALQGTYTFLQNSNKYLATENDAAHYLDMNNNANKIQKGIPILTLLSLIWLIGSCFVLGTFLWVRIVFRIQLRSSPICYDESVLTILENVKRDMNIQRSIRVVYNEKFDTCAIFSITSPQIILPKEKIVNFTNEEMEYIFKHELTHYKRKDLFIFGLITILKAINWFNPLIWFAFYKMEQECEISCDAEVLKALSNQNVEQYGMTLIKIASSQSNRYITVGGLGLGKNTKQLKRRIIMISKFQNFKAKKGIALFVAMTLLLVTGILFLKPVFSQSEQTPPQNIQLASTVIKSTENNNFNVKQTEETEIVESVNTVKNIEAILPGPKNVYNYVNEISADFDTSGYDINKLREEANKEKANENIIISDEFLLQQKMGHDIFQTAAKYFNINFQEAVDLFQEGAREIEDTKTFNDAEAGD